jgi:hypothetical protein
MNPILFECMWIKKKKKKLLLKIAVLRWFEIGYFFRKCQKITALENTCSARFWGPVIKVGLARPIVRLVSYFTLDTREL